MNFVGDIIQSMTSPLLYTCIINISLTVSCLFILLMVSV